MDTIITNNVSSIAISTKMVIFGKDGIDTKIDISKMFKDEDEAYIEVTEISKAYGKRFRNWTRLEDTQEYIKELEKFLDSSHVSGFNKSHKIGVSENNSKVRCLENKKNSKKAKVDSKLIIRKAGRYGGTYLHKKIALKYFRWLDKRFEIAVDLFLEKLYKQITVVKISRVETKAKFRPLTDAIRDIFIPAQTNPQYIQYAYPMIMDLINIKVLGMKAWEFREKHNIPKDKDIHTRDYFSQDTLDKIVRFQQHTHTLLVAGVTDFKTLEKMINNISL